MTARRLLALPVVAASLLAVLPASAADPLVGEQVQSYAGSFLAPTRFTDGAAGFPGLGRRLYLVGEQADGVVADVFDVSPEAWGGSFVLGGVTDATGAGDLDVYLYDDFGNIATQGVQPVSTAEYDTADKGEKGFIPPGTTKAIVFTPDAVNASFTFKAFKRPDVALTALDGVVLPAGATLGITNDTGDYAALRHVAGDEQEPLVDLGGAPGTGVRAGETVPVVFATGGSYVFETSVGTATVTVTDGPGVGTPAG